MGIITLAKKFGKERVEAACKRALAIGAPATKASSPSLNRFGQKAFAGAESSRTGNHAQQHPGREYYN